MRKINRRNYLLQMGAGAAGIVAASELPLVGQTKKRPTQRGQQSGGKRAVQTTFLRWPITGDPPNVDAFVTAVYAGIAGFTYNDRQVERHFVDVVFHPGNGGHNLEIQIYKNPPKNTKNCTTDKIIRPRRSDRLRLEPSGPQGAMPNVFEADSKIFDRNSTDPKYAYDFRWMPDLESTDFYPDPYGLNRVNGTRLAVYTGTFYTRARTLSTFWLVDEQCKQIKDYGHIALYMATAINTPNEVRLLDQQDTTLYTFVRPNTYQIVFTNECESTQLCPSIDVDDCADETKRNDFHFLRKVVRVPVLGRLKFGLKIKDRCSSGPDCDNADFCIIHHGIHRLTDEAPCSGAGYGRAPGFS